MGYLDLSWAERQLKTYSAPDIVASKTLNQCRKQSDEATQCTS